MGVVANSIILAIVFAVSAESIVITCEYDTATIVVVGDVYYCYAMVNIGDGETIEVENVIGNHMLGFSNDNVTLLEVTVQNLPFVPRGIDQFFRNLQAVEWYNSNLLSISAEDLEQFPNLMVLSIFEDNLVSLDSNLFMFNPNLHWLNLGDNLIEHVGADIFTDLEELAYVNFYYNPCVNRTAFTREAVLLLNDELPILCPPLVPEPEECPAACADRIELAEAQIQELLETNRGLEQRLTDLENRFIETTTGVETTTVGLVPIKASSHIKMVPIAAKIQKKSNLWI